MCRVWRRGIPLRGKQDDPARRRDNAINRLLADSRWADHWMGYWLDVLAEYLAPMAQQNLTQDEARAVLEYIRSPHEAAQAKAN